MESMLCHIYHGAKEPLLSLAGSVGGVITPMVHLDHVGESEVLIGTHGYIRDPSGRWWRGQGSAWKSPAIEDDCN